MTTNAKRKAEINRIKESIDNARHLFNLFFNETLARLENLDSTKPVKRKEKAWEKEVKNW